MARGDGGPSDDGAGASVAQAVCYDPRGFFGPALARPWTRWRPALALPWTLWLRVLSALLMFVTPRSIDGWLSAVAINAMSRQ